ncbi:MAG: rRNA maturation RNase YbeY [Eubacteriales bacterium]|nr:rRNA maturation RNase YbeY [Eubacteriales bacterium]
MMVYLEREVEWDTPFDCRKVAEQVVEAVLDYEECPYEAEVCIMLTNDAEIHSINMQQRGIDRATDVLSFPMVAYPVPGKFDFLEEEEDCFHPETGELLLGDIVISIDHVENQAKEYGHSVLREYAFLIVHSMFHLLGYDHMTQADAAVMEEKQRGVMEILKISRDGL